MIFQFRYPLSLLLLIVLLQIYQTTPFHVSSGYTKVSSGRITNPTGISFVTPNDSVVSPIISFTKTPTTTTDITSSSSSSSRLFMSGFTYGYGSTNDRPSTAAKIIIAGAPASGKGTQCEFIKERYGVVHLSTGDMLREAVSAGTSVGIMAKEYMDSGRLVPDEVIIDIVKDRLQQSDCQTCGWLLDGFPRTQAQATSLAAAGVVADVFIFLNVPDDILIERVVGRRTDPVTGKIYHMKFSPPPVDVVPRLQQRSDDTVEKISVRLEQFHANVNAIRDNYVDIAITIDGTQPPNVISGQIFSAIDEKLNVVRV